MSLSLEKKKNKPQKKGGGGVVEGTGQDSATNSDVLSRFRYFCVLFFFFLRIFWPLVETNVGH